MPEIVLKRIERSVVRVPVAGTAPLIMNKFSQKARQIMLDKQMGEAVQREPKNPSQLYEASLYRLPPANGHDRYGYPAPGFKAAIVNGARYFKGSKITMELLKQAIFVRGEGGEMLVPLLTQLDGDPLPAVPKMREDTVRNQTGVADIRFRGEFWPWYAWLDVVHVPSMLPASSVVALVDAAGMNGVGEWRPGSKQSKTGTYGTWRVADEAGIQEMRLT